jgi:hypothetical protein
MQAEKTTLSPNCIRYLPVRIKINMKDKSHQGVWNDSPPLGSTSRNIGFAFAAGSLDAAYARRPRWENG